MRWTPLRILGLCVLAFFVGMYAGESKRLVVTVQDCVKYRGLEDGMWR